MFIRLSTIFIIVFTLFSCSKNEKENSNDFVIDEIKVSDLSLIKSQKGISELKDTGHYFLNLCIKDPAIGKPVISESFQVSIEDHNTSVSTDLNGCAKVHLPIEINPTKCESFEKKNLHVKATGNYSGEQNIQVYFNPANISAKNFHDSRFSTPSTVEANNCKETKLSINSINLTWKKSNTSLKYSLNLVPELQKIAIDGQRKSIPILSDAVFNFKARIITDINSVPTEISSTQKDITITKGKLKTTLEFKLPNIDLPSENTQYKLEYHIIPKIENKLHSVRGVIVSDDITLRKRESLTELDGQIEAESINNTESLDGATSNLTEMTRVNLLDVSEVSTDAFSQDKMKKYEFETCLFNKLGSGSSERLNDEEYNIESSKNIISRLVQTTSKTNENGCFIFHVNTPYKMFKNKGWINELITVTTSSGEVKREISLNPWNTKEVYKDMKDNIITQRQLEETDAELDVKKVNYGQIRNVDSSYYVNKFTQLFFKKKYFISFNPKVKVINNEDQIATPKILNFGKIAVRTHVFKPNSDNYEINKLDLQDLTHISSTENIVNIEDNGRVYYEPELPFEITDTTILGTKGILIIEIIPSEELEGISRKLVAINFFGTNSNSSPDAFSVDQDFSDDQYLAMEKMVADKHAFSKSKLSKDINSIDLYRNHLKSVLTETDLKINKLSEFVKEYKSTKVKFNAKDITYLMQTDGKIPAHTGTIERLCAFMFKHSSFLINSCKKDFYKYVKVMGAKHITKHAISDETSYHNGVSRAYYNSSSEENEGSFSGGTAYFAAYGHRYSKAKGNSDSLTGSISGSLYYDGPPSVFFLNAGVTKSYTSFNEEVNASMQAAFTRNDGSLRKVNLRYNAIEVGFNAYFKRCFLLQDIYQGKKAYHICDDNDKATYHKDKWYFIGEKDAQNHGVLTDGIEVGENHNMKIIRGERNFNKLWKKLQDKDYKTVIGEMEEFNLGEKFLEYKQNKEPKLEFEIFKDNSFPGLIK